MKTTLPQYLLFDLDGTLLDSLPGIAFSVHYALDAVGLPDTDALLRRFLGPPIRTIFSKLVPTADHVLLDRLESAFRTSYDSEGWQKTKCYQGAKEMLGAMTSQGRQLFVVSNKPRAVSIRILKREGLLPYFTCIYTRDSRVPPYLSKAEMLSTFLQDYGLLPSDCLMVGDTMEDVAASDVNQIDVALMEHGYGDVFSTVPVRVRFRNFSEFLTASMKECVG